MVVANFHSCHLPPYPSVNSVQMSEVDDNEGSNAAKATNPTTERMPGKSLFPVARVQKILKADAVYFIHRFIGFSSEISFLYWSGACRGCKGCCLSRLDGHCESSLLVNSYI